MKPDLYLILHKEVTDHRLTPEQSLQIATRYQEIQEIPELTEGERHAIFHAWMDQHFYQLFYKEDQEANAVRRSPIEAPTLTEPLTTVQERGRKEGQQVLF